MNELLGGQVPAYIGNSVSVLVGPAGMPADIVNRMNAETAKLLARPDVKDKLAFEGSEATPGTPQQFAAHIRAEHAKWGALIREANIKIE